MRMRGVLVLVCDNWLAPVSAPGVMLQMVMPVLLRFSKRQRFDVVVLSARLQLRAGGAPVVVAPVVGGSVE